MLVIVVGLVVLCMGTYSPPLSLSFPPFPDPASQCTSHICPPSLSLLPLDPGTVCMNRPSPRGILGLRRHRAYVRATPVPSGGFAATRCEFGVGAVYPVRLSTRRQQSHATVRCNVCAGTRLHIVPVESRGLLHTCLDRSRLPAAGCGRQSHGLPDSDGPHGATRVPRRSSAVVKLFILPPCLSRPTETEVIPGRWTEPRAGL